MVVHIVMWKVEAGRQNEMAEAKEALEALAGKIPGLTKLEVITSNLADGDMAPDMMLYSELESEEALRNYGPHPEHQKAAALVKAIATERRVFDYVK